MSEEIGDRLRQYRQREGLSIYDVGEMTGRHFSTISKYERGERQPSIGAIRELAEVYQVPPGKLISQIEDVSEVMPDEVIESAHLFEERRDIFALVPLLERLTPEQIEALQEFLHSLSSFD